MATVLRSHWYAIRAPLPEPMPLWQVSAGAHGWGADDRGVGVHDRDFARGRGREGRVAAEARAARAGGGEAVVVCRVGREPAERRGHRLRACRGGGRARAWNARIVGARAVLEGAAGDRGVVGVQLARERRGAGFDAGRGGRRDAGSRTRAVKTSPARLTATQRPPSRHATPMMCPAPTGRYSLQIGTAAVASSLASISPLAPAARHSPVLAHETASRSPSAAPGVELQVALGRAAPALASRSPCSSTATQLSPPKQESALMSSCASTARAGLQEPEVSGLVLEVDITAARRHAHRAAARGGAQSHVFDLRWFPCRQKCRPVGAEEHFAGGRDGGAQASRGAGDVHDRAFAEDLLLVTPDDVVDEDVSGFVADEAQFFRRARDRGEHRFFGDRLGRVPVPGGGIAGGDDVALVVDREAARFGDAGDRAQRAVGVDALRRAELQRSGRERSRGLRQRERERSQAECCGCGEGPHS